MFDLHENWEALFEIHEYRGYQQTTCFLDDLYCINVSMLSKFFSFIKIVKEMGVDKVSNMLTPFSFFFQQRLHILYVFNVARGKHVLRAFHKRPLELRLQSHERYYPAAV